ncbi:Pentatricopeptide repeat [Melia azedarach]|uniref:Pentatricopeptide repeat n=2 Tax=Melia azedarach TaxID=155640 RepID=A0ACC1XKW9_MELAZ|nr:Pentatricopeptide repeat [Melia azedarach]
MASTPFPPISQFSLSNHYTNSNTQRNDTTNPLSLISKCNSLRELKQIQSFAIKTHLQNDHTVLTKLINFCTQNPTTSSMEHAHLLFDRIPEPDIVLFNTMARGYSRSKTPIHAIFLFVEVLNYGLLPDDYTFPSLLKACASMGAKALQEGKQLHCFAIKLGLNYNVYVCPTLINMYAGCNDVDAAKLVFDKILDPCVVSYNAIITGYARSSRPNEALSMFRELQERHIKPTDVTMLSALSSCSLLGSLDLGKWIHEYIKKYGFDKYVKVNTALIDMYAKCGSLDYAISIFDNMSGRDTQAWSAMIVAYATHGQGHKAISMFEEMIKERLSPDEITFLGLLYACSHTGLVDEGYSYFYIMREKYGIVPGIKHYGCMVDLLSRAGRLNEAYRFIDELPIKPTPILWRTLLSACSSHGNLELAKQVSERIFELDDSHGGDYVILSNLCARAGRWEDVDFFRKLMRDRGVVKIPGCSSIEVNNVVHEFFSGDGVNSISSDLHKALDELVKELKMVGYKPDISLVHHGDMEYEKKEITLRYHSEKLAITFGLLNTPPGSTIRVVKNLRVCGDCHSAAKLISLIFDREIVLRDVQRFHHFKDGKCSCGDFW